MDARLIALCAALVLAVVGLAAAVGVDRFVRAVFDRVYRRNVQPGLWDRRRDAGPRGGGGPQ